MVSVAQFLGLLNFQCCAFQFSVFQVALFSAFIWCSVFSAVQFCKIGGYAVCVGGGLRGVVC